MAYLDFFPIPLDAQATVVLSVAVGLAMTGMAVAFFAAEPKSPVTRAFVLAYGLSGLAAAIETAAVYLYPEGSQYPWFAKYPIVLSISLAGYPLWLLRLARTAQPTPRAMAWILRCVSLQWVLVALFFVFGSLYHEQRLHEFYLCFGRPEFLPSAESRILAALILAGTANLTFGGVVLFTQRIDPAERRRVLAFAVSFPFLAGIFCLPAGYNSLSALVGALIFLIGTIPYYVIQGERGQFMSRFLSPQVAELVRQRGLEYAMQPQALNITVVCCDLRGFTRLSQLLASEQVIRLLNEYYDVVGSVVAEFGATIKDYAGDGVLILVGAPLPVADHVTRGLALAQRLNGRVHEVIDRWVTEETPLGCGMGVASGAVAVGAIGSISRMEYTAVGLAVNLASRLCAQAHDGEILVDALTAEQAGQSGLEPRGQLQVKGMTELSLYVLRGPDPGAGLAPVNS
jgi:class 3 adenylate cyclase